MKLKNKKLYLLIIGTVLALSILIGISYSYYAANVKDISKTQTYIKTNTLGLTYTGETEINCDSMVPGNKCVKTFKVKNTSEVEVWYNIYMENITNEFNEDLVYTLTDENGEVIGETVLPETNAGKTYLKKGITIDPSPAEKTYTLTIEYKYLDTPQNDYQGAEFKATVGIDTEQTLTTDTSKICRRATELHTNGANSYGNLGTSGTLVSGDAYDCDVDGSGTYDADERFYYVSDYYNTTSKEFETDTAVLVYSGFIYDGEPTTTQGVDYDVVHESSIYFEGIYYAANYYGPVSLIEHLPTTTQWNNVSLKNTSRAILNMYKGNQVSIQSGVEEYASLPTAFSYAGYAARLLTLQEIESACSFSITEENPLYPDDTTILNTCSYLKEGAYSYEIEGLSGYWLETVGTSETNFFMIYSGEICGTNSTVSQWNPTYVGLRPVIEVPKSNIEI